MNDINELRRLAEAATPGPWLKYHDEWSICGDSGHIAHCEVRSDADYIAAANPAVILALLSERDALRDRVAELEGALKPFAEVADNDIGDDETDDEIFVPMLRNHRAPLITVGNIRAARKALSQGDQP